MISEETRYTFPLLVKGLIYVPSRIPVGVGWGGGEEGIWLGREKPLNQTMSLPIELDPALKQLVTIEDTNASYTLHTLIHTYIHTYTHTYIHTYGCLGGRMVSVAD